MTEEETRDMWRCPPEELAKFQATCRAEEALRWPSMRRTA
jgi:hypothetical protein